MKIPKHSTKISKKPRKLNFPPQNSEFPLVINRQEPQQPTDLHSHDFDELVIITEGNGIHESAAGRRAIFAGDVFLLRRGEAHAYIDTNGLKLINILFKTEKVLALKDEFRKSSGFNALFKIDPQMRTKGGQLKLQPKKLLEVLRIVEQIEDELIKGDENSYIFANCHFLLLIATLARAYKNQEAQISENVINLARVISFMEKHYIEDISIAKLCKIANMSRATFFREFIKTSGYSPHDYILRLRIFNAMNELNQSQGKVTIKECAFKVGFRDSNYFSRIYKKFIKERPSQTKKRAMHLTNIT